MLRWCIIVLLNFYFGRKNGLEKESLYTRFLWHSAGRASFEKSLASFAGTEVPARKEHEARAPRIAASANHRGSRNLLSFPFPATGHSVFPCSFFRGHVPPAFATAWLCIFPFRPVVVVSVTVRRPFLYLL